MKDIFLALYKPTCLIADRGVRNQKGEGKKIGVTIYDLYNFFISNEIIFKSNVY